MRFVNVNVAEFDAAKHGGLPLVGDARAALDAAARGAGRLPRRPPTGSAGERQAPSGTRRSARLYASRTTRGRRLPAQAEVIGASTTPPARPAWSSAPPGSAPGDLHKLWRARDPAKGYHLEYGYSCMGYEIAGGLGVKLAAPEREVYVLVGDGSYLMLPGEIVTAVPERIQI